MFRQRARDPQIAKDITDVELPRLAGAKWRKLERLAGVTRTKRKDEPTAAKRH